MPFCEFVYAFDVKTEFRSSHAVWQVRSFRLKISFETNTSTSITGLHYAFPFPGFQMSKIETRSVHQTKTVSKVTSNISGNDKRKAKKNNGNGKKSGNFQIAGDLWVELNCDETDHIWLFDILDHFLDGRVLARQISPAHFASWTCVIQTCATEEVPVFRFATGNTDVFALWADLGKTVKTVITTAVKINFFVP